MRAALLVAAAALLCAPPPGARGGDGACEGPDSCAAKGSVRILHPPRHDNLVTDDGEVMVGFEVDDEGGAGPWDVGQLTIQVWVCATDFRSRLNTAKPRRFRLSQPS